MKKLVRTNLTNSPTRRGTENLNIQFYSHDKNNAGFEFVVKNETDLSQYTAKVLFKFRDSNSTWQDNGTVEGNVVKVNFNTDLIARCEEVLGFLFLDSESNSLDVFKFKFNVVLSEIDKGEVANRQIKHVNNIGELELVTRSQLRDELSKLQINGVDLSNYLTTRVAEETYAKKQELSSYALSKDVPSINGLVTEAQLKTANNGVVEEIKKLGYAKTTEIPAAYNDSELTERVTNLENKEPVNLSDYVTKNDLKKMSNSQPTVDASNYVSKTELNILKPNQTLAINNKSLSISGGNSVELPVWEIHGSGMPNGVVTANIGTTYVDENKTNGALKWIKTTNGGNTGWRVFTGDTGWRTLPLINKRGNAKLQIRRINDEVIVKFDGLSWGWFGVDDMSRQDGNIVEKTIGSRKYTWIKLNIGQGNNVLPVGFRSASSLLSGLYGDLGDLLGSVYVGGTEDSNAIQLRYAMGRNEITSNILSQIRISPITFITDDDWPVQLP
nr:MAG TPA: hypothetical protein [Caudoviricetes sp.]